MPKTAAPDLALIEKTLAEQDELLKKLTEGAGMYGTVVDCDGPDHFVLQSGSNTVRVNRVKGVHVGDTVNVIPETLQIASVAQRAKTGATGRFVRSLTPLTWEIEVSGAARVVGVGGRVSGADKVRPGTQVLLDFTGSVVVELLPNAAEKSFKTHATSVTWDSIGGNERAKAELRTAISLIRGGSMLYESYKMQPPKGMLMYGPPGCGKTLLGKAAATELSADGDGAFMYVKAPELLNMYVGETERRIREVFAAAKEFKEEKGHPAILFLDEADALLQRRGTGISSDVEKTIVPTFLTEMDGLEQSSALVILATNRADTLDPAVIRDGRIDRRIAVERPSKEHGRDIFRIFLKGLPLKSGESADTIAGVAADHLYGHPEMSKVVSGALIAAAVERAKKFAVNRDMSSKKVSGLSASDLISSMNEASLEY